MARFLGSDEATVDEKGRFPLPVKFRRKLERVEGAEFVLQPGVEGEILAIPAEHFETLDDRRSALDPMNPNDQSASHAYGEIEPVALDKAGRLTVPPLMRAQFGIEGVITVTGGGAWLAIWNRAVHAARTVLDRERALKASSQRALRSPAAATEA